MIEPADLPRTAWADWPGDAHQALAQLVQHRRVCVLTGAGISTDSGIPDYRSPGRAARKRPPIQHREFVHHAEIRQRYWARSALGWPHFRAFLPNRTHALLAAWERRGQLAPLITQNVDRLHHKGGHQQVIELHGALAEVVCLACGQRSPRDQLQTRFADANLGLTLAPALLPDGDAELSDELVRDFVVPACLACGGVLMPDVVFFGGSVPKPRVANAFAALDQADVLLVLGSSLTVFSGYRFVLRAVEAGKPVAIVNRGPTRADALATVRIDAGVAETLTQLLGAEEAEALGARAPVRL